MELRRPKPISFLLTVLMAVPVVVLTAVAAPPPAGWFPRDMGGTGAVGSTDVAENGIWRVRGSGVGILSNEDSFHYVYRLLKGNASISARFISAEIEDTLGVDVQELAGFGLMIRENDTPGSPNLYYAMTPKLGLATSIRFVQGRETEPPFPVGPSNLPQVNLYLRLQRVGQEIAGFYSPDGSLWTQAIFPTQVLTTLKEEALFGLAVTSHRHGDLITGMFDNVSVQPGTVSVSNLIASSRDRSVLLQWRPVPGVEGYNVYRGPAKATREQLVLFGADRVGQPFFIDGRGVLANGTPVTYGVTPVFKGTGGNVVEGPMVAMEATPVSVPPGWLGCALGPSPLEGSAIFDQSQRVVTLRGAGRGIVGRGSELYFLNQPMEGDVQITARLRSHDRGVAGLMIREELDPIARNACIYTTNKVAPIGDGTLFFSAQPNPDASIVTLPATSTLGGGVTFPVVLRLTRRGNTIEFEYSTDTGRTYRRAAAPVTFDRPLPRRLYVGLVAASGDRFQAAEARFDIPSIQGL